MFVVVALVIDMELSNLSDLLGRQLASSWGIAIFILILIVYCLGQRSLLEFATKHAKRVSTRSRYLQTLNVIVRAIEYVYLVLFTILIFQILIESYYYTAILSIVLTISNALTIITMALLAERLFSYYRSNKNIVVLLYAVSSIVLVVTAIFTLAFMVPVLESKELQVTSDSSAKFPIFQPGSIQDILNYLYYISAIVSYLSLWISTVILLHKYSKRLGRAKFWTMMCIPIIFYIAQVIIVLLIPYLHLFDITSSSFIFYYRIIFTVSSTVGGILFGVPYLVISKKMINVPSVRNYINLSGIGFILFFVAGSATVYHTPYPPYGLATVALIGISSYFIFLGLYCSALSVSEDAKIRQQLRKYVQELPFLGVMGSAEVQQKILLMTNSIRDNFVEEFGIEPSISVDDTKRYLNEVLSEMKTLKKSSNDQRYDGEKNQDKEG